MWYLYSCFKDVLLHLYWENKIFNLIYSKLYGEKSGSLLKESEINKDVISVTCPTCFSTTRGFTGALPNTVEFLNILNVGQQ